MHTILLKIWHIIQHNTRNSKMEFAKIHEVVCHQITKTVIVSSLPVGKIVNSSDINEEWWLSTKFNSKTVYIDSLCMNVTWIQNVSNLTHGIWQNGLHIPFLNFSCRVFSYVQILAKSDRKNVPSVPICIEIQKVCKFSRRIR